MSNEWLKGYRNIFLIATLAIITSFSFASVNQVQIPFLLGSPTVNAVFLPVVMKQPTATQTVTPTPTATPVPHLLDGDYVASLSYGGDIHFSVTNGGTVAMNAGFSFKVAPWCSWGFYEFSGSKLISDGYFRFVVVDVWNREIIASLSCNALSSTEASCSASRPSLGAECTGTGGLAVRQ